MSRSVLAVSTLLLVCTSQTVAQNESSREFAQVDASGAWIETTVLPGDGDGSAASPSGIGIIWQMTDPISIVRSVALADTMDESWVAQELNSERLSYLQTTGTGIPIYEFDLIPEDPSGVTVASAEDASLGLLLVRSASGLSIRGFTGAGGATPIWTYNFDANFTGAGSRSIDASLDGSIVIAAAWDSGASASIVVILDGATGAELRRMTGADFASAVELSYDGSRAVLSEGATARIIDTSDLSTVFSFTASGGGSVYHRISGDGTVVAAGGFLYRVYREDGGGTWSLVWSEAEPSQWYGFGLALSGDGRYLFAGGRTYTTNLDLTYRVVDLVAGVELARTTTSGGGSFQDVFVDSQASADGQVFAVASWGVQDNAHPEVQMFDRSLNLIGSIDTPGSPFSLDLSRDGRFVLVGGKSVHANVAGNGSDTFAYELDVLAPSVPTISTWGLIVLTLAGFAAATLRYRRGRAASVSRE